MTYSVHQHWDPLKVCAVGRSYPPEFYSFIKNSKARSVMERIAEETEEDYQNLIKLLEKLNVEVVRSEIHSDKNLYLKTDNSLVPTPPMCPRDYTAMIGDTFYMPKKINDKTWQDIRGDSWPEKFSTWDELPTSIQKELENKFGMSEELISVLNNGLSQIEKKVKEMGNKIIYTDDGIINTAMITRVGKDLYHGTSSDTDNQEILLTQRQNLFPTYRNHVIDSQGHSDSTFCPVKPGLIISLYDIPTYKDTFPTWEVVYLPGQSWHAVKSFTDLKEKNRGKFWVPGEEYNDEFTNFVNEWLDHWVGYVEETVFDVNMLVIDEKNVICNNENDQVFEAFGRHGITPHICNFRHRYFWDGGIHCITSDLHREGHQKDYFSKYTQLLRFK